MFFYWISRFLSGDFKFALLGGLFSWAGWLVAGRIRARWLRVAAGLVLAGAGIWLAHWIGETVAVWWVTPLGEPLKINR